MYGLPRTPQTLPCDDDDDPFFIFGEDGSLENDGVGVEIGVRNTIAVCRNNSDKEELSSSSYSVATSRQTKQRSRHIVGKKLNFEEIVSAAAVNKQGKDKEESIRSNRIVEVQRNQKNKRRLYRSKSLNKTKLSDMIKAAVHSPDDRKKDRRYFSLEDEEDPIVSAYHDDDQSSSPSLPSLLVASLPWKKKSSADTVSTSSSLMSRASKSKLKWSRLLQRDSLATFKAPDSSPSTIPVSSSAKANKPSSMVAIELSSSSSTVSSAASCTSSLTAIRSIDNGDSKRAMTHSPRPSSLLPKGLYSLRVDEEDDEDTDVEDDDHPAAGSFAFAIGRGEC
jgi:hypothetical protein